jgi:hypothetical protein
MSLEMSRRIRTSTPVALVVLLFWGAAAEAQLTIMPLGASETWGYPVPGGYRARLYTDLQNAGYSFRK